MILPALPANSPLKYVAAISFAYIIGQLSGTLVQTLDEQIPDNFWVDDRLQKLVEENRNEFLSIDVLA